MKKFILYIVFFAIPIVALSIIVELNLRKIPNNYSYKSNYLDRNSRNVQILFLGSSHAYYGINPEFIKYNSFNAAMTSQTMDYDLKILEKYNGKWDNLKVIILPVDYFSMFGLLKTGIEAWRVKNYNIYYGFNSSISFADNTEIFSIRLTDNYKRLIRYISDNKSDLNCTTLGFGTDYHFKDSKDLDETGKTAAKRHTAKDYRWFDRNSDLLASIVSFAKKQNIKIILYTSPAYKTYVENLEKNQLNRTYEVIQKIVSANTNVKYYNLLNDKSFNKTDFYDGDHLNDIGAKKMTLKMDSLVKITK